MGVHYRLSKKDASAAERDPEYAKFISSLQPHRIYDMITLNAVFTDICSPETKEKPPAYRKETIRMHIRTALADGVIEKV